MKVALWAVAYLLSTTWAKDFNATHAQAPFFAGPSRRLISPATDRYALDLLSRWNSSGLSVAVVTKDPTASNGWRYEFAGYGVARGDGAKVTADTIFSIASNSKLFLAVSVGLLITNATLAEERGAELKWTTRLCDLIPEWSLGNDDASRGATIQDLLSHRTGLPRHDFSGVNREGGVRQMISTLKHLRPSAEFRETFQYNNLMYETLSHLPRLLLNQSYESYVDQHIFRPLDMSSSTFSVSKAEQSGNFAHGYQWDGRDVTRGINGTLMPTIPYFHRPGDETIWAGAGGILTSARDLAIWLSTLMNEGKHPRTNAPVIPATVLDHLAHGRIVTNGKSDFPELSPTVYGSGLFRYSYRGHEIIEHGGNNFGFKSQVARFPQDGLGVISLSNDANGGFLLEAVKWRIADEFLGLKPIDWNQRYEDVWSEYVAHSQHRTPRPTSPQPPTSDFDTLARGSFSHPTYGTLEPCLVPQTVGISARQQYIHPHSHCDTLLSSYAVKRILSQSNLTIPTFIIPWKRSFVSHLRLTHFNHNTFNLSVLWNNADVREREGYGKAGTGGDILLWLDEGFEVEWVSMGNDSNDRVYDSDKAESGLAFKGGFWGSEGPDVRIPTGNGRQSAEVWFEAD